MPTPGHLSSPFHLWLAWPQPYRIVRNPDQLLRVTLARHLQKSKPADNGCGYLLAHSVPVKLIQEAQVNRRRLFSSIAVAAFAASAAMQRAAGTETAVKPEISPPGDIPDSQVFITFTSPAGFSIKVPEGWARKDGANETVFSDKYNRIALTTGSLAQPLDLAYAKSALAPEIEKSGRAVKIVGVSEVKLRAGKVVKIAYDANSAPNDVTNKQIRQENERFYYAKGSVLVALSLTAPKGADNVDQWKLISSSFRWK